MSVWTIHETDLFHPHQDPDDHWDLACQFALAKQGYTSLEGVMIDWPEKGFGDPAVAAVAQMNWISGLSVPVGVGKPRGAEDITARTGGVGLLIRTLERAPEKVTLHIVGSCREIAAAGGAYPDLFREKVGAVYLNAGSAFPSEDTEYNVMLDTAAYAACFSLPCPVYWMPCFHVMNPPLPASGRTDLEHYYGTFYSFRQDEILPFLSPALQNYFHYLLTRSADTQWLKVLRAPVNPEFAGYYGSLTRNMWCTGGFLHAAGLKAARDGRILPLEDPAEAAYGFVPIRAECDDRGVVRWERTERPTNRYIFCVNDPAAYGPSLTEAMKTLLQTL